MVRKRYQKVALIRPQRNKKSLKGKMDCFLTPEELSKMLKVSRVWIFKLCDQGRIPFFRLAGKVIRFRVDEIERWIEDGRGGKYLRGNGKEG